MRLKHNKSAPPTRLYLIEERVGANAYNTHCYCTSLASAREWVELFQSDGLPDTSYHILIYKLVPE